MSDARSWVNPIYLQPHVRGVLGQSDDLQALIGVTFLVLSHLYLSLAVVVKQCDSDYVSQ